MKFTIEIGTSEKHHVEYHFNQLLGQLTIKIDDKPIKKAVRMFNEPVVEIHDFVVGDREQSSVRIEKERMLLFGQRNRLFVDDRLVKVFNGV